MGHLLFTCAFVLATVSWSSLGLARDNLTLQSSREAIRLRWQEDGVDFLELSLASQEFRGTQWRHVITLAKPLGMTKKRIALVTVGGGDDPGDMAWANKDRLTPADTLRRLKAQAKTMGGIVASIGQIPFQPIFDGRKEDDAISYTLAKFFETGDKTWPLLGPMTEAVSRALDSIAKISASEWHQPIRGVVLTGASKRGWTTWLSAAQDPRVKAIAPEVFDILNIPVQLDHQLTSWGRYSEEIGDYSQNGLPAMLATARGKELLTIIDPYVMRHRIHVPKLVILGTSDAYWPVDAASLYFNELKGPKYLLYMPNAGHEIADRTLIDENLKVLSRAASGDVALPEVTFHDEPDINSHGLVLHMKADQNPVSASLWMAHAKTRDFRQSVWSEVRSLDPKKYLKITIPSEPGLYTAAFVRAGLDLGGDMFTVTSLVKILPPK